MTDLRLTASALGIAALVTLPIGARGNTYQLRRDNVLPVVFEASLTLNQTRPGDFFTVRVADSDQLPMGTALRGRIDRVRPAKGNHPASLDLHFTDILLPDRSRVPLDASPLALDDRYMNRLSDGHLVAKSDIRRQQSDIFGGAIGGFIIGSLFHRRVTGAMVGTITGNSVAEEQWSRDSSVIIGAGDKFGALINRDVMIDYSAPPQRFEINRRLDRRMADPVRGGSMRVNDHSSQIDIQISFRGQIIDYPSRMLPFYIGTTVMVAIEPSVAKLQLEMERGPDRTIRIDGSGQSLTLTLNSRNARLDGKRFDLPRTVLELSGALYVPLEALLPLVKDGIFVNGKKAEAG